MSIISKPMLAGTCKDVSSLVFPVLATPKLDGIRFIKRNGEMVSRNFKKIPNHYIRKTFEAVLPDGIDGEILLNNGTPCGASFSETSSAIMSRDGKPDAICCAFDYVSESLYEAYEIRIENLLKFRFGKNVRIILPEVIRNEKEIGIFEKKCLSMGFEGIMVRSPNSPYKCGRSTEREQYLLKLKRFSDSEAIIIGFEEKYSNQNEAETDLLGHAKRSHTISGMIPCDTLGRLTVVDCKTKIEFGIGSGFNDLTRDIIWNNRKKYIGKIVKYKFQESGTKDKPRFPVFLGFRSKIEN